MMTLISAADNISIETEDSIWRLVSNRDKEPHVLAEASAGQPLRYSPHFGTTRRLPTAGQLLPEMVQQVVVGWSHEDEAWHLGLVLQPELAELRGSRWCELVHWPDPDTTVFTELVRDAGQQLAGALGRPFRLIPPEPLHAPPPPPLPALPLQAGYWALEPLPYDEAAEYGLAPGEALIFRRSRRWVTARIGRILWYLLWVAIYLLLSIATLTSSLAPPNAGTLLPNPEILPFLGLATAAVLLLLVGYQLYQIARRIDRVIVDPQTHSISGWKGTQQHWQISGQDVQSVYVSEVMRRRPTDLSVQHGEISLHLGGGKFQFVLQQGQQIEQNARRRETLEAEGDQIFPLDGAEVTSGLQGAGLHIAHALGSLPCWYDLRLR